MELGRLESKVKTQKIEFFSIELRHFGINCAKKFILF